MSRRRLVNQCKGRDFTETFPSTFVLSVINQFIFGLGVVIYFIMQITQESSKNRPRFPSRRGNPLSASTAAAMALHTKPFEIFVIAFCCKIKLYSSFCLFSKTMTSHNITFIDFIGALFCDAFNQNRNTVVIWSVEMCFIFLEQINVMLCYPFMKHIFCVIAL